MENVARIGHKCVKFLVGSTEGRYYVGERDGKENKILNEILKARSDMGSTE